MGLRLTVFEGKRRTLEGRPGDSARWQPVLTQPSLCHLVLFAVLFFLFFDAPCLRCAFGGPSCGGGWFCWLCDVLAARGVTVFGLVLFCDAWLIEKAGRE